MIAGIAKTSKTLFYLKPKEEDSRSLIITFDYSDVIQIYYNRIEIYSQIGWVVHTYYFVPLFNQQLVHLVGRRGGVVGSDYREHDPFV